MSNNKQSSVDRLIDQLAKNGTFIINELGEKTKIFTLPNEDIIKEAEEMHKMDIRFAFNNGKITILNNNLYKSSEEYYNETFGNDKPVKIGQGGFGVTNGGDNDK